MAAYKQNIVDRPMPKGRSEVCLLQSPHCSAAAGADTRAQVTLSAFAFLFSELVQYCQIKVTNVGELERRSVSLRAAMKLPHPLHDQLCAGWRTQALALACAWWSCYVSGKSPAGETSGCLMP